MDKYLEINGLQVFHKTFEGEKKVLDIKHLEVKKGETFGLVGESGAGKTVLALTILKLLAVPPGVIKSGSIIFNGKDLLIRNEAQMRKIRGKSISMIFQDPMSTLNPVFTVGEQIIRVISHNRGYSRKAAGKEALKLLNLVKLPDAVNILGKYPHELSGGQRQRIIIAIALSCDAELLIADEPTRNLDVTIQAGILKLIAELQKELKITVLYIANNLGLVSAICDRVGILNKGEIIETGTVREVLRNPLHPYTLALLNSIINNKEDRLQFDKILFDLKSVEECQGCGNYLRCPNKRELCKTKASELKRAEGSHYVSCHKVLEEGMANERATAEN